jgi:hypothetical protein
MKWTISTGASGSMQMAYDASTDTAVGQLSFGPETVTPETQPAQVSIVIVAMDTAGNQVTTDKNPAALGLLNCPGA